MAPGNNMRIFNVFIVALFLWKTLGLGSGVLVGKGEFCGSFSFPSYEQRIYARLQFINNYTFLGDWNEEEDYEYVLELTSTTRPPGGCDINQLLVCRTIIGNGSGNTTEDTQNGKVEFDSCYLNRTFGCCQCSRHFSYNGFFTLDNMTRLLPCEAQVGYPCRYRLMDDKKRPILLNPKYACAGHATCEPIYGPGEDFISYSETADRIFEVSGVLFDQSYGELVDPLHRYMLRYVDRVCKCPSGPVGPENRVEFGGCNTTSEKIPLKIGRIDK